MKPLPRSWFADSAVALAPKLLGKIIRRGNCSGIVVETEAYAADPASHAFRITPRSAIMRDTYGHWYIYFTYGMHWCANVTTDAKGVGAVLIRAVEPIEGITLMKRRRGTGVARNLCSGPAKFCEAFGITGKDNRTPLDGDFARHTGRSVSGFAIYDAPEIALENIGVSGRIGIKSGTELPWRFYIKRNPFVSRKR
ncbi:MAG: DNA-3-methyladenine glycosylase [Minisyncoccota bacterium]